MGTAKTSIEKCSPLKWRAAANAAALSMKKKADVRPSGDVRARKSCMRSRRLAAVARARARLVVGLTASVDVQSGASLSRF